MIGSTLLGAHGRRLGGALAATVLAGAACTVAATVTPPTAVTYGAVTTIAGGGNGPVSSTPPPLAGTQGLARFGNMLYFGTNNGIVVARNLDTGEQTLYAGSQSQSGYAGDLGLATDALLENVGLMAVDHAGDLFLYETGSADSHGFHCDIREIDATTHVITTFAGADIGLDPSTQVCNPTVGDGGNADVAGINPPYAMAFDSHDNLFLAGHGNNVRRIDAVTHVIDTYAGAFNESGYIDTPNPNTNSATPRDARFGGGVTGFAFDASDNLYLSDIDNYAIRMIDTGSPAPVVTTVSGGTVNGSLAPGWVDGAVGVAQFDMQRGGGSLALSPTTNELYISDGNNNNAIRSLSADRTEVTTIAGDGTAPDGNTQFVGPALGAAVYTPQTMAFDAAGGFYFMGNNDNQLRYIDTDGIITYRGNTPAQPGPPPFTGDGGQATDAIIQMPTDLLRIGSSLYVAESGSPDSGHAGDPGNRIRKIDLETGLISTFAGTGEQGFAGDGGAATAASLNKPQSLASDGHSVYVSSADARIRRIDIATGIITTVAGTGTPCDLSTHACGDRGPATGARIGAYVGLASASGGRLLIGDAPDNRIRCIGCDATHPDWMTRIAGTGTPGHSAATTLAPNARVTAPYHVVVAPDNTIVFSEVTTGLVRRINANGPLSTVAGTANPDFATSGDNGPATSAKIPGPMALRYDAAGNLDIGQAGGNAFVGQFVNPGIRQVNSTTGIITTIAGNGAPGFSGDGGSAKLASFFFPISFAPDDGTHLYVADMINNRVRRIRGTRPDLVTTTAVSVFKAGTTGTLTVNEQSANGGWVSGPVKAIVTLPALLNYQSASGIGWTCRASTGHTVTCTHARGIAPRTAAPVALRLAVTAGAAATVSVHTTSTSNSDVLDASHQSKTRSIHIVH